MASEPRYPFDCWKFASSLSRVVVRFPLPSVLIYKLLQFKPPTQAKKGKVLKTENCGDKLFRIFQLDYYFLLLSFRSYRHLDSTGTSRGAASTAAFCRSCFLLRLRARGPSSARLGASHREGGTRSSVSHFWAARTNA